MQADSLPAEPQGKPKDTIPSLADLPDPGIEPGSPALLMDMREATLLDRAHTYNREQHREVTYSKEEREGGEE